MLVQGDARHLPLRDGCVQTVVTSPPYWGLRDYGHAGQIGLEKSPEEYVQGLVQVFREVRRVLREDGTVWVNLGDSYAANRSYQVKDNKHTEVGNNMPMRVPEGLKAKDLVGIPWRVAFALQSDGWYLRSDIIWAKPNPMPESVTDRPTRSHEYVFLLTKRERYYYDFEGAKEPVTSAKGNNRSFRGGGVYTASRAFDNDGDKAKATVGNTFARPATRNRRSVWTITTKPYAGAHFATFPPDLVEPCILAGTPEGGCCAACRTPFRRLIEKGPPNHAHQQACGADARGGYNGTAQKAYAAALAQDPSATKARILAGMVERRTVGWQPQCRCGSPAVPSLVLDPFVGSGTGVAVAERLGRRGVGVELKGEYLGLAQARLAGGRRAPMLDKQAGHDGRRHDGFNARYFGRPPAEVAASPAVSTRPSFLRRFR